MPRNMRRNVKKGITVMKKAGKLSRKGMMAVWGQYQKYSTKEIRTRTEKLAARIGVSKERFFEEIKEHGYEGTLQHLREINLLLLELNVTKAEMERIREMIKNQGLEKTIENLRKQHEEEQQMQNMRMTG